MIRDADPARDAPDIARIYSHYIATDTATFETEPVSVDEMWARIEAVQERGLPWLIDEGDAGISGYAYAAPYRPRSAYRHTLETTVYLDALRRREGIGTALYEALLERVAAVSTPPHAPVHTVVAVIALPHPASVAFHERLGFAQVGTIRQAGRKFDRWIDVGHFQRDIAPR